MLKSVTQERAVKTPETEAAMPDERRQDCDAARRAFLTGTLAAMAGGGVLIGEAAEGADDATSGPGSGEGKRRGVDPSGAPADDVGYTPGIVAQGSRIVFVSGQGPKDLKADMETQLRQTMERIGEVLESAGASFANVAILRGYFVHLARDMPIYRKIRRDYLVKPYPASSLVGVTELAIPGLDIEIEAVAVL